MTPPPASAGAATTAGKAPAVAQMLEPSPGTLLRRRILGHAGLTIGGGVLLRSANEPASSVSGSIAFAMPRRRLICSNEAKSRISSDITNSFANRKSRRSLSSWRR